MSDEVKKECMKDTSTIEKKIETIVFNTLKDRLRGHIYAKMEEKANEKDDNTLYINISNYGVVYTDRLTLPGNTFEMVSQDDGYAKTLALMIYDNFKKYIDTIFFIADRPRRYSDFKRPNKVKK